MASRRVRRRVVLAFWGVLVPFMLFALLRNFLRHGFSLIELPMLIPLPAILGGFSGSGLVKPFHRLLFPPNPKDLEFTLGREKAKVVLESLRLDERESLQAAMAMRQAYSTLLWMTPLALVLYALVSTWRPAWGAPLATELGFLLVTLVWTLPQTLILWETPDLDVDRNEPEAESPTGPVSGGRTFSNERSL
jgi:hypothetical protein